LVDQWPEYLDFAGRKAGEIYGLPAHVNYVGVLAVGHFEKEAIRLVA
jgi:hypothetical protein